VSDSGMVACDRLAHAVEAFKIDANEARPYSLRTDETATDPPSDGGFVDLLTLCCV
jgi:hypothetical protein